MKKLAALLIAAPLALAACGGSSHSSAQPVPSRVTVSPVAYVKQSAKKTAETSVHMTMSATMNIAAMSISMNGSGDFSYAQHDGSFSINAAVMGQNMKVDEVLSGSTIYMSSPLFAGSLPAGKTWMKLDLGALGKAQGTNIQSLLSQSPGESLKRLEAAGKVTKVGHETINGDATTKYRVTELDLSKLFPPGVKLPAGAMPKFGPINVWIGDANGYVYRETMSFSSSSGGKTVSMTMVSDLSNFGEAVNVSVPPASETADMSQLAGMGGFGG